MDDKPIWTDAECNRYIWKFFWNGFGVGASLATLVALLARA